MENDKISKQISQEYDVIVVGGGLSGCACARRLKENGQKVLLVEARDRLGGRTYSFEHEGEWFDYGGQWLGATHTKAKDLAKELGLKIFDQFYTGKNIVVGPKVRYEYSGTIPWIPSVIPFVPSVPSLVDLDLSLKKFDKLAATIDPTAPWDHPKAAEWDSITLDEWQRKNIWTDHALDPINVANRMIMSIDTHEISFLYFLWYLRASNATLLHLADVVNGAQEVRVEGGAQKLAEGLGKIIGDDNVVKSAPVRKVIQDEKGVQVVTDVGTFKAKYTVLAIPPALANVMQFQPLMPVQRLELTSRMPMGSVIKTIIFYEENWWRGTGYTGQIVNATKKPEYPILSTLDDSDENGKTHAIVGFIIGGDARRWAVKTKEERRAAIEKQYAEQFKNPKGLKSVAYYEIVWPAEEFSRGCYVGICPPGVLTSCGQAIREPVGRIHFAGTEASTSWCGYMEGAIIAGEEQAEKLSSILKK